MPSSSLFTKVLKWLKWLRPMSCCVSITQRWLENFSKNQQMKQDTMNAVNGGTHLLIKYLKSNWMSKIFNELLNKMSWVKSFPKYSADYLTNFAEGISSCTKAWRARRDIGSHNRWEHGTHIDINVMLTFCWLYPRIVSSSFLSL